jgi:hypothetical protein
MLGFLLHVYGPLVFLSGFKERMKAADQVFPGVAENRAVDLGRGMIVQANCRAFPRAHDAMPFSPTLDEWTPIDPRKYRKEVPTAISEITP